MIKRFTNIAFFAFTFLGLVSHASANLILDNVSVNGDVSYASGTATPTTIGGYAMTDFVFNDSLSIGDRTSSITSLTNGTISFVNAGNNATALGYNTANNVSWWNNGEATDYDIFTTDLSLITILLPENTRAFSFNVGANVGSTGNNAWLTATETDGSGINSKHWFNVNRNNTPGFGIYADNSDGSCSAISSVTIDPDFWGFGNFSINQDSCTSVPEPAPIALLALGLIGLGFMRKKQNA